MWVSRTFDCIICCWPFSEPGHHVAQSWSGISTVLSLWFIQDRFKYIGRGNVGNFQYCVTSGLGVEDIYFQDLESVGIQKKLLMLLSLMQFVSPKNMP